MPSFIAPILKSAAVYSGAALLLQPTPSGAVPLTLAGEVLHRRLDGTPAMRHAGEFERHLDGGDRAQHHRLVQIAEMADAEHAALQSVQSAAERHVELVERGLPDLVGGIT